MPIITPAYPSMCATHNVTVSTKTVILRELQRGGDIVDKIFMKQLTWKDLFTRHTFFSQDYKYYLCITSSSKTKEAQSVWSGLVESKLRHLVGALDRKPTISVAHPFPKGFERVHVVRDDKEAEAVKNGSTQYQAQGTKTETTDETKDPTHTAAAETGAEDAQVPGMETNGNSDSRIIYTTTYYIGLELKPLEPGKEVDLCRLIVLTCSPRRIEITGYIGRRPNVQINVYIVARIPARYQRLDHYARPKVSFSSAWGPAICLTSRPVSTCPTMFSNPERHDQRGRRRRSSRSPKPLVRSEALML